MNLLPAIFGFGGGEFFASLRSAERIKQHLLLPPRVAITHPSVDSVSVSRFQYNSFNVLLFEGY